MPYAPWASMSTASRLYAASILRNKQLIALDLREADGAGDRGQALTARAM